MQINSFRRSIKDTETFTKCSDTRWFGEPGKGRKTGASLVLFCENAVRHGGGSPAAHTETDNVGYSLAAVGHAGQKLQGNLGASLCFPNLKPSCLAIQPRSRCLSEWGCNILGYTQGQEGFSKKGINWMHKWMCKARRPDQTERGTRETMHSLKTKNLPPTSLPPPHQMVYRRRINAESYMEMTMVEGLCIPAALPSNDQYHIVIAKNKWKTKTVS